MSAPPIFDGHNDTLLNLHLPERGGGRSFFKRSKVGHLDLPRALEGGFGGGLFACFVPNPERSGHGLAPPLDPAYARKVADELVERLFETEAESDGEVSVIRTASELEECLQNGTLAAVLHFEGAENLGPEPGALEELYERGLRSLGLVWSRPNAYGHGVPFRFPGSPDIGAGLRGAGRALVRECNRLGVLLDLSHLNEQGFRDVAAISEAPLVASHSNVHALCPTPRNLTDRQLDAIRASGGMVGVNLAVGFLREDGREEAGTPLETVVRHVEYLAGRMGIDHVGLGSDFDGATVPRGIGDASGLPKLLAALRERGYGEKELEKLAHGNWLRVLRETWGE